MATLRPLPPLSRTRLRAVPPSRRRRNVFIFALLLGLIGLLAWWLLKPKGEPHRAKTTTVTVTTVRMQDMPLQYKSIGTIAPINSVQVKPHVSGQIIGAHFREGQPVAAGQLLFAIDPRPLQAVVAQAGAEVQSRQALVAQAQAAIAKDQAALLQAQATQARDVAIQNNAARQTQRYLGLATQGAVSAEQYEQYRTNLISTQATVAADQAAIANVQALIKADRANLLSAQAQLASATAVLRNAQVQLSYASITSPISGLAGNMQFLPGNQVRQDTDTLVTINQMAPIYVNLTVPEQQFNMVRTYASTGSVGAAAYSAQGELLDPSGRLVFANNTVDPATGTVLLRAIFPNASHKLWPGQFVNTMLTLTVVPHAIVVPDRTVQTGQNGTFVWLVNPNSTVAMQPVRTAQSVGGWTVITAGLRPGQTVVTDGQMQLSQGTKVAISHMQGL